MHTLVTGGNVEAAVEDMIVGGTYLADSEFHRSYQEDLAMAYDDFQSELDARHAEIAIRQSHVEGVTTLIDAGLAAVLLPSLDDIARAPLNSTAVTSPNSSATREAQYAEERHVPASIEGVIVVADRPIFK